MTKRDKSAENVGQRRMDQYKKDKARDTVRRKKQISSGELDMPTAVEGAKKDEIYRERKYYTDSDLVDSYGADAQRSKGFGREFQMSGGGKVRGMGAAKQGGKFTRNG